MSLGHFFSRKGLKSPQSKASMAWGLGLSLGFLKLSLSERSTLSTSTGSVLPVNLCTGSSLQRDSPAVPLGTGGDPQTLLGDPVSSRLLWLQAGISQQFIGKGKGKETKRKERVWGQQSSREPQEGVVQELLLQRGWHRGQILIVALLPREQRCPNPAATPQPEPTLAQGAQPLTLAHASFSFTISLSGSTFKANLRFLTVHSWPQKIFCRRYPVLNLLPMPDPTLGPCPEPPPGSGASPGWELRDTHRVLGQSAQDLGEVGVHLLCCALEELPAAPHEQGVTCGTGVLGSPTGSTQGLCPQKPWGARGQGGIPEKRAGASGESSSHMK